MILASFLEPIENVLTEVLKWLHDSVGLPWAWSIVALTLIVRVLIVPLTVRQIHSMQNMQRFTPQMQEIKKKYKNDRQKQNEELMKLFRENQINPAASCLPILLQIPVFFALYYVLRGFETEVFPAYRKEGETVEDLHWLNLVPNITDPASSHWSGIVLLVVYLASQTLSTYFMSTAMQKSQRIIMLALPIVFVFVVVNFPSGLVLYWMTTNLWTVGQGIVTRTLTPKAPPLPPKRSSRTPKVDEGDGDGAKKTETVEQPAAAAQLPPRRVKRKKKARR